MQRAYAYAEEGGTVPLELETAWRVGDIGAEAVLGPGASARLIRRVALSERVYDAYLSRAAYRDSTGASNWSEWAQHYPKLNRLLIRAIGESDE